MKEKGLSCFGLVFTACLVHGTLLASSKMFQKHTFTIGDIHLGLPPSRRHSCRGIRLGLPCREHLQIKPNQIYVIIFSRPIQLTSKGLLFKRRDLQNDNKTSITSLLCQQNGYNSIIQSISHQNTCSFSHPLLHTHRYTPSQPPTHPPTHHCWHQQDSHIAGPLQTTQN